MFLKFSFVRERNVGEVEIEIEKNKIRIWRRKRWGKGIG